MIDRPPCRRFSASLVLLLALAGCNIVAPIAVVFEGPQMTPPEYVLQDRATVVFVDDHNTVIGYNVDSVRRSIADTITSRLLEEKVLARMIRPQDAMVLSTSSDRHDNLLSIEDIGRKVGADQVIYLNMHAFTGSVDGVQARPVGVCLVKVIDVQEQRHLYPDSEALSQTRQVMVQPRDVDPDLLRTRSGRLMVYNDLALHLGEQVAKLFYEHETRELGRNLNPL